MKEIVTARKLDNGRWEATLTVVDESKGYATIKSRTKRSDVTKEMAVEGVKRAANLEQMLDKVW